MRVTILGSGTSHGIPVIGCRCDVCISSNPKDKRSRSSILIEESGSVILIDTSIDFRIQALRAGIDHLDAVLMTHGHADHLHGLDDTRTLSRDQALPIYGSPATLDEIRTRFDYIFKKTQAGGGKPNVELAELDGNTVDVAGVCLRPIPIMHGDLEIYGYKIGNFAYLTDCSEIPHDSFKLLGGVTNLVIGALRYRPHATHFSIDEAITASERIGAANVWFTHLCHDVLHAQLTEELRSRGFSGQLIRPAYDGLVIET
jgi:phosphoribosyl 1,2-cyclic phosphate phosphodiesterase